MAFCSLAFVVHTRTNYMTNLVLLNSFLLVVECLLNFVGLCYLLVVMWYLYYLLHLFYLIQFFQALLISFYLLIADNYLLLVNQKQLVLFLSQACGAQFAGLDRENVGMQVAKGVADLINHQRRRAGGEDDQAGGEEHRRLGERVRQHLHGATAPACRGPRPRPAGQREDQEEVADLRHSRIGDQQLQPFLLQLA